jgi:predicted nucleic acid-binding protein
VKFWDSSAIVPLIVAEPTTRRLQSLAGSDTEMLVWWGSEIECVSALARLEREAALDAKGVAIASRRLGELAHAWHEVEANEAVRDSALRFLRVHPLRAADALQLAAAFEAAEHRPTSLQFVTLDERLANAAQKEGFAMVEIVGCSLVDALSPRGAQHIQDQRS